MLSFFLLLICTHLIQPTVSLNTFLIASKWVHFSLQSPHPSATWQSFSICPMLTGYKITFSCLINFYFTHTPSEGDTHTHIYSYMYM